MTVQSLFWNRLRVQFRAEHAILRTVQNWVPDPRGLFLRGCHDSDSLWAAVIVSPRIVGQPAYGWGIGFGTLDVTRRVDRAKMPIRDEVGKYGGSQAPYNRL